jgi:subtilisin family serine protease
MGVAALAFALALLAGESDRAAAGPLPVMARPAFAADMVSVRYGPHRGGRLALGSPALGNRAHRRGDRGDHGQGGHGDADGSPNSGPRSHPAGDPGGVRDPRPGEPPPHHPAGGRGRSTPWRPPVIADGGGHIVCIGGQVRDRRCDCRPGSSRQQIDRAVFACRDRVSAARLLLPVSSGGARRPAASPPRAAPRAGTGAPTFAPDEVLVTLRPAAPSSVGDAIGSAYGLELLESHDLPLVDGRVVRYRIPDGRPVAAVVAALQSDPRVANPQPNFFYRHQQSAAAGSGSLQYALARIDALRAQAITRGRGALVAVIDSAVDATHPDLAGAVVDSFDATGAARTGGDAHGTAVSGIICADGLLHGIAPEARLISAGVFPPSRADGASAATTLALMRGIAWSRDRHARILNMSLAGPRDPLLERGLRAAIADGAIVVAAAGNGGPGAPPAYPAAYDGVIAVTATDVGDRLYVAANRGSYVALAAPGVDILAPAVAHGHALLSGTSFAAAHVSGIIALMIGRNPQLSAEAVRLALVAGAADLGPPGRDDDFGAGRANALSALRAIDGQ